MVETHPSTPAKNFSYEAQLLACQKAATYKSWPRTARKSGR